MGSLICAILKFLVKSAWKIFWVLLSFLTAFLQVRSYDTRLAHSIADDHPAIWAQFFKNNSLNPNHPEDIFAQTIIFSSLPNLIAAFSTHIHDGLPHLLSLFFIAIQIVGLVFALYQFCILFCSSKTSAILTSVLTFWMQPWTKNLAYYPNFSFTPYPGQLVLPFLMGGITCALRSRLWMSALLLSIGGLIHPSLTLQSLVILAFFRIQQESIGSFLKTSFVFILPFFAALILPLGVVPKSVNPLTSSELLPSALSNPHLVPWNNAIFWSWEIPSLLAVFILSGVAIYYFRTPQANFERRFFRAHLVAFLFLGGLHLLSVKFHFLEGILLCPLRVTSLNALMLLPFGVDYLIRKMEDKSFAMQSLALTCLSFFIFSPIGLPWFQILGLFVLEKFRSARTQKLVGIASILWWGLFLFSLRPMRWLGWEEAASQLRGLLAPALSLSTSHYLMCLFLLVLLAFAQKASGRRRNLAWMISVIITGIWTSYQMGANTQTEASQALVAVQQWAHKNTSPQSIFITSTWSWKGLSHRKNIYLDEAPKGQVLPYFRNRTLLEWQRPVQTLFSDFHAKDLGELSETGVLRLGQQLQADFLVLEKSKGAFSLPKCFENSHYQVFSLTPTGCPQI